jgi:hypothetical protein
MLIEAVAGFFVSFLIKAIIFAQASLGCEMRFVSSSLNR